MTTETAPGGRTLIDVDLDLLALVTSRNMRRWHQQRDVREQEIGRTARLEFAKKADALLDERLSMTGAAA